MRARPRICLVLQAGLCLLGVHRGANAQQAATVNAPMAAADSDGDGLDDALEQRLLTQFAPHFMVGEQDCSVLPARFQPDMRTPEVMADDGTIYGQAFPAPTRAAGPQTVELHFFHLWRKDCGGHGHRLDTEHVAALVQNTGGPSQPTAWKAVFWYAAAHENTVCDVSQIARATTLHAVDHGATVWISPGKHASYLRPFLCGHGCGADHCRRMVPLPAAEIINLGEAKHPMNGSVFINAAAWPLRSKMLTTNFPADALSRLNALPQTEVAYFRLGRHPAQEVIADSYATEQALTVSGRDTAVALTESGRQTAVALTESGRQTAVALSAAGDSTSLALLRSNDATTESLSVAGDATGIAVAKAGSATASAVGVSFRETRRALGSSARHVRGALGHVFH